MERLTGPLAEALKRGRSSFNAKFLAGSKADAPIERQAFQHHLAVTLDPIVRSVAAEFAERTDAVAVALFDLSLDLFAKSLLGPAAKYPAIDSAWRLLLPRMPRLMAREPAQVAGAVTNALYNLSQTPRARPQAWTEQIGVIAATCQSAGDLMACGSVLAWRCGMPQYRESALDKAGSLAPVLATRVLGLPDGTATERIAAVLQSLRVNPWILPQEPLNSRAAPRELKLLAKAGAFRGFAGQFLAPPKVARVDAELVASDGTATWRLHADIYNSLLLRTEASGLRQSNNDVQIQADGTVRWKSHVRRFPELANATSIAAVNHTMAVTIPTSHHLFLLGFV
jgi:hypothetical protein